MLLDEANDFSCATANDVAFKMLYLPSSFKIARSCDELPLFIDT
jgi:hypothetical protein